MRKLGIVVLAMFLVLGLTSMGFAAQTTDNVGVNVTVAPYYKIWFDTPTTYKGLFGNTVHQIGQPGIYISDGQATVDSVTGIWNTAINSATANGINSGAVLPGYFAEGQLSDPQVELFKVDANTEVDVTLSGSFSGWMNAPTLFRVSSDENDINGIGDWTTDLAVIGNSVNHVSNPDYNDLIDDHNDAAAGLDDTFSLDFAEEYLCHGPLEFHLNGALWMPKASQVAAGDYEATLTVTVAAANGQGNLE